MCFFCKIRILFDLPSYILSHNEIVHQSMVFESAVLLTIGPNIRLHSFSVSDVCDVAVCRVFGKEYWYKQCKRIW